MTIYLADIFGPRLEDPDQAHKICAWLTDDASLSFSGVQGTNTAFMNALLIEVEKALTYGTKTRLIDMTVGVKHVVALSVRAR